MAQDANRLIWIDLEMSGLNPDTDRILELAIVVTDAELEPVGEAPVLVVHQDDAVLEGMDSWNRSTHGKSGLLDKVRASTLTETEAEDRLVRFLEPLLPAKASPMCGNSVCQDRRFLARYMPRLEAYFHYRNLDVSTLKELARRWRPEVLAGFTKQGKHEALADIYESIAELKHYRASFLRA
ncbi:MAG: oligoribonuclease [Pseudomonadota bacterium]